MDRQALFERASDLWPEAIDLSAGCEYGNPDSKEAVRQTNLWDIYSTIEDRAGHEDHWLEIAAWSFHQSLWQSAMEKISEGRPVISPSDVPFSLFDRNMKSNLMNESWAEVRDEY